MTPEANDWVTPSAGAPADDWAAPPPPPTERSLASYLPKALSDIPREAYQSTADALSGAKNALLPKSLGGERDASKEGAFEGIGKTGSGLLSLAQVPIAPFQGAWRSLAGHTMESADKPMRDLAVQIHGEDKIRELERSNGNPQGGLTYEQAKEKADLAASGLAPGRGGLPALKGPPAAPVPPTPNGPLGVTLSEGQLTRDLPAIRNEQAAMRGGVI